MSPLRSISVLLGALLFLRIATASAELNEPVPLRASLRAEFARLERRHPEMSPVSRFEDERFASTLRMAMSFAATDLKWSEKALRKEYSQLYKTANVIGVIDERTPNPKLVMTLLSEGTFFYMITKDEKGEIEFEISHDYERFAGQLRKIDGQSYLVLSKVHGTSDTRLSKELYYLRMDPKGLVEQRSEWVELPRSARKGRRD